MRSRLVPALLAVVVVVVTGGSSCKTQELRNSAGDAVTVPKVIAGSLKLLAAADTSYAPADKDATPGAGRGGVSKPHVVQLTGALTVYRVFGPPSFRRGRWWTFDAPTGSLASYRERYEVCEKWSSLRLVVTCTLQAGSVVVIGPGQSVSAVACDKAGENYPANDKDLQVFIKEARTSTDLSCPDESKDYQDDPKDISKRAP